jgi:REP element-mobilizing transposase RayT/transposase-like protein
MARHARDLASSTWFHIVNRGVDRQDIFRSNRDRSLFEDLMAESITASQVEVHAYALMSNHFHLLVHSDGGDVSGAMKALCGRYAAAFNQRHERTGPLFTSRFHSTPVTSDAQLVQTGRYIHRNPLAFVPPAALHSYRWSSLPALLGRRSVPSWLATGVVVPPNVSADEYLASVRDPQGNDREAGEHSALDVVERIVLDVANCSPVDLYRATRSNRERSVAVALALQMGVTVDDICRRFGVGPRSVRRLAATGRDALSREPIWAESRHRLLTPVTQVTQVTQRRAS